MTFVLMRRVGLAVILTLFLAVTALSVWYGGSSAWSDVVSLQTRWQIDQWRNGKGPAYSLARWEEYRSSLLAALRISPDNAQLHEDLGYLYTLGAQTLSSAEPGTRTYITRQNLLSQAIASYEIACKLRPTFPYSWVHLAFSQHLRGVALLELLPAFDKAMQYGRTESDVRTPLALIAFAHWPNLDSGRKDKVVSMVTSAPESAQKALRKLAADHSVDLPAI